MTRPEPDATRMAAALRARGHEVLVAPLLSIAFLPADFEPGPWRAVLITSANAVRALATAPQRERLFPLPVFTVGQRTAEAARALGFEDVRSADGDAAMLSRLVQDQLARGGPPILYLAGEDRARDLAGELTALGLPVRLAVIYRAEMARGFPEPARAALAAGGLDGVLHLSRRSAEAYLRCAAAAGVTDHALVPAHYCLSDQVAGALIEAGAVRIHVARQPEESALLDLVERG
ncbi:MAG: uroporphyrinogen-III synthase [Pseudorhodoplanes sp.]